MGFHAEVTSGAAVVFAQILDGGVFIWHRIYAKDKRKTKERQENPQIFSRRRFYALTVSSLLSYTPLGRSASNHREATDVSIVQWIERGTPKP